MWINARNLCVSNPHLSTCWLLNDLPIGRAAKAAYGKDNFLPLIGHFTRAQCTPVHARERDVGEVWAGAVLLCFFKCFLAFLSGHQRVTQHPLLLAEELDSAAHCGVMGGSGGGGMRL